MRFLKFSNPVGRYVAVAVDHRGVEKWRASGDNYKTLMADADRHAPNAWSVTIRDDRTSDGTYWGPGQGRVVASREKSRMLDGWHYPGWMVEVHPNPTLHLIGKHGRLNWMSDHVDAGPYHITWSNGPHHVIPLARFDVAKAEKVASRSAANSKAFVASQKLWHELKLYDASDFESLDAARSIVRQLR